MEMWFFLIAEITQGNFNKIIIRLCENSFCVLYLVLFAHNNIIILPMLTVNRTMHLILELWPVLT